ncbi:MAG: hypothetical protein ABIJ38_00935 [Patescibacteria group bacterium]
MLDRHLDTTGKWQLVENAFKITHSKKFKLPLSKIIEKGRLTH